jgi:hypothetical protein
MARPLSRTVTGRHSSLMLSGGFLSRPDDDWANAGSEPAVELTRATKTAARALIMVCTLDEPAPEWVRSVELIRELHMRLWLMNACEKEIANQFRLYCLAARAVTAHKKTGIVTV